MTKAVAAHRALATIMPRPTKINFDTGDIRDDACALLTFDKPNAPTYNIWDAYAAFEIQPLVLTCYNETDVSVELTFSNCANLSGKMAVLCWPNPPATCLVTAMLCARPTTCLAVSPRESISLVHTHSPLQQ